MGQHARRIAIDGRPARWPRTGIGTIVRNVLRNISHADAGCNFYAYFDSDPGELSDELRSAAMQTAFGGPRQKLLWSNTWVPRRLAHDEIDVFVTFLDKDVPLLRTRSKIVLMVHDLIPLRFPEVIFRNALHQAYYNVLIRAAVRRADLVLTNSEFSKSEIVSMLPVNSDKVQRISLGAEQPGPPAADAASVMARFGLVKPFALALGASEPRKNNIRVIQAFRLLSERHPELRLAIAGSPWRGKQFPAGLVDQRVSLLGHVPDEDLRALMRSAEMLVFPSLHEGFGFPVLEAMTLGVPVVTSKCTALPEVGGDAALYVDPDSSEDIAEKMNLILSDAELAARLRQKGCERAKAFRWESTCAEIVDLCAGLMESCKWQRQPALQ
jgi:glycosyltransferase involved in cell wall biosynthesis